MPTIYQAYRPVEEYFDLLERAGCAPSQPNPVRPIDALALGLVLAMSPPRTTVVDLAADVSSGASTLLCRRQPRAGKVVTLRPAAEGPGPAWRSVLEHYLAGCDPTTLAPSVEVAGEDDLARAARELCGTASPLVLLPAIGARPEDVGRQVACWLGLRPDLAVALAPLGETGRCEHLASLVTAFGGPSPHRLALVREQAAALHECRLGLVYRRDHPHLDGTLARLGQLFTGNFTFLSLVKGACEAALQAGRAERAAEHPVGPLAEARRLLAEKDQELAEARRELAEVIGGLSYKLARRLARARALVAPEGSARHRALRTMAWAVRVWKAEGARGVAARTAEKLSRRGRAA